MVNLFHIHSCMWPPLALYVLWTEVKHRVEYREEGSMKVSRNVGTV